MSFKLRIFIGGACGFVPAKPVTDKKNLMTVLFPDTTDAHYGERHYSELWFDRDDLVPCSNQLPQPPHDAHGSMCIWHLDQSDLTVVDPSRTPGRCGLEIVSNLRDPDDQTPQGGDEEDYSWLADMGKITQDLLVPAGKVKSDCFGYPGKHLAARLTLDYGKLSTSTIYNEGGNYPIWEFRGAANDSVSTHKQALATWLEATITIDGDYVDIESKSLKNGAREHNLRLKPRACTEVKVHALHLSWHRKLMGFRNDPSFKWMYRLSQGFNGPNREPRRHGLSRRRRPAVLSPFTTFCPGGGYDPHDPNG